MANELYPIAIRALLSDEAFEKSMEEISTSYFNGDRSAIFSAITLCAQYQAVMPDWVVNELIKFQSEHVQNNKFGRVDPDFNAFFGSPLKNMSQRAQNNSQKLKRLSRNERRVLDRLVNLRTDGESFNIEDGITSVAEDLGLPRREVETIYKSHKELLKKLKKGPYVSNIYLMEPMLPIYKRTGRTTLPSDLEWSFTKIT